MQHYEKSADFFRVSHFLSLCEKTFNQFHVNCFFFFNQGEESNSSANKCMLKVAMYAAQLENYDRAIKIYEQVFYKLCII